MGQRPSHGTVPDQVPPIGDQCGIPCLLPEVPNTGRIASWFDGWVMMAVISG
jgi:hypothetical protein